jgi:hypothetical protein
MDLDSGLDVLGINVIFEPVDGQYEKAKAEYLDGLVDLVSENSDGPQNYESSIRLQRQHFGTCVAILRELYDERKIEHVERLPFPIEIVFDYEAKDLEKLALDLGELYFQGYKSEMLDRIRRPEKKFVTPKSISHYSSLRKGTW